MFGKKHAAYKEKKRSAVPPHPGPDADGVTRVMPKEIWDGPHGDFLREIGVSPDDASNVMPTQQSVQAKADKLIGDQTEFLTRINGSLREKVVPWAMIPWSIWQQSHADFLLVGLDFYPVHPFNTLLLPETERGELAYGLPRHLGSIPAGLEEAANRLIGNIRDEFEKSHNEVTTQVQNGDLDALKKVDEFRGRAFAQLCVVAHQLGKTTYGEEAFERHKQVWGKTLGWPDW